MQWCSKCTINNFRWSIKEDHSRTGFISGELTWQVWPGLAGYWSAAVVSICDLCWRASAGGGRAARGEGRAAGGEGRAARGGGRAARGEGRAAGGEGRAARGEGRAARGEGRAAGGEGRAARGEGRAAGGEGRAARGGGRAARGSLCKYQPSYMASVFGSCHVIHLYEMYKVMQCST